MAPPAAAAAGRLGAARRALLPVTVEPVLFLFMVGSYMQYTALQSLIYAKVCQERYSSYVCDTLDLAEHKPQEDEVQDQSSYWMLLSNVALAVPSVISGIYIGTWSDVFGRKVPLLLPPLGQILSALAPVDLVILASGVAGALGGFAGMILVVMSYLSAVTATGARTARVGVLEAMSLLGGFIGPFVGSLVFEQAGRTWTFCALLIINVAIVLYVVLLVREVPPPCPPPAADSLCETLTQLFSLRHLLDAILTSVRSREGRRRRYILMLLASSFVIMLNSSGEMHATYLFVRDAPLAVEDSTYFAYFAYKYGISSAALLIGMPLSRRYFPLSDTALSGLGLTSKILGLIWLGFAVNKAMLFIAPLVMILNTFCIPPIRSMLSKLVEDNEQGRIFSMVMVIESLCSLFGSLVYNSVYPATRRHLHGLVFLLGAASLLVPVLH
ncbi:proton-coupled folate transporter-like [Pollicipes pollicipes]|uniref:proton-coupled folate transporter-like n=1 Tax=Pollicipes pollicipes TaxID=41117 RepID=UPI00188553CA|nr:proton-coupled folate transporter-like [Pollicipes pollicipes]